MNPLPYEYEEKAKLIVHFVIGKIGDLFGDFGNGNAGMAMVLPQFLAKLAKSGDWAVAAKFAKSNLKASVTNHPFHRNPRLIDMIADLGEEWVTFCQNIL